jgi:hypothetical protein
MITTAIAPIAAAIAAATADNGAAQTKVPVCACCKKMPE